MPVHDVMCKLVFGNATAVPTSLFLPEKLKMVEPITLIAPGEVNGKICL
ncbi:MAG TPA: hypothetical protein VGN72_07375 [Tepidisphaeraceae bacterium]|jgi:hypothetical protein|nr:hypothetical protein [Tepidisphaeraceae bacterium]